MDPFESPCTRCNSPQPKEQTDWRYTFTKDIIVVEVLCPECQTDEEAAEAACLVYRKDKHGRMITGKDPTV